MGRLPSLFWEEHLYLFEKTLFSSMISYKKAFYEKTFWSFRRSHSRIPWKKRILFWEGRSVFFEKASWEKLLLTYEKTFCSSFEKNFCTFFKKTFASSMRRLFDVLWERLRLLVFVLKYLLVLFLRDLLVFYDETLGSSKGRSTMRKLPGLLWLVFLLLYEKPFLSPTTRISGLLWISGLFFWEDFLVFYAKSSGHNEKTYWTSIRMLSGNLW